MYRVGGFTEYSPAQQLVYDEVIKIIKQNYQQFGFTNLETPAVEKNSTLTAKSGEDAAKQIFGLYGLAQGTDDAKNYSLRFDLTVPFARYVLDWESELTFPFKRSQIQTVWRGERQQKGRFKELVQADVDVIWAGNDENGDYLYYDAEAAFVIYKTLIEISDYLGLDDKVRLQISNRNLIGGYISSVTNDPEIQGSIAVLIDKYYKIGEEDFVKFLEDLGLENKQAVEFNKFIQKDVNAKNIKDLKGLVDSNQFDKGVEQLAIVLNYLDQISKQFNLNINYKVDFAIIRGLDYYTGTVLETFLEKNSDYGSVCSGGRYDNLTSYIDPKRIYGGVGFSIGVSRFISYVFDNNLVDLGQKTISEYMFVNFEETFEDILKLSSTFIKEGKILEIYPKADKLKKQFSYADKKGISNVVVLGEGEKSTGIYKVKNMKTGEEKEIPYN